MSRSGYSDDVDNWALIRWRGQVSSAIRGKRGQAFLKELVESLDSLPAKRLISNHLQNEGEVCAMGAVGVRRGIKLEAFDIDDYESIAIAFGVAHQLVQEIEFLNDELFSYRNETPEERWSRVRAWADAHIKSEVLK